MKLELYSAIQNGFNVKQARPRSPGGDWRGGNSGCMTEDGIILGSDPRVAVLRHLGVEMPVTLDDDLIFEAGFKNEEHWTELLEFSGTPYKVEEEIPVVWNLPNGESITGRPDIVVGHSGSDEFSPKYGIELKLISSNGKMLQHSHFGSANPSAGHVCQSAHYSHQMGIPWVLAYTSRSYYSAFYWKPDRFPLHHRSMLIDDKSGKVLVVKPFVSLYDLTWQDGTLLIDGKETIITADGIERYYQYCSDCVKNKVIPEPGGSVDVWGTRIEKNNNVLYFDYKDASTEDGFDQWVSECLNITMRQV